MNHHRSIAVSLLAAGVLSACGSAAATSPAVTQRTLSPVSLPARHKLTRLDRMVAMARVVYDNQVRGPHSLDVLHKVGSDPVLVRDLQTGRLAAARAYVASVFPRVWYHWHVSRLRVTQGNRVVTEVGVPFVMPASQMTLRAPGGRSVGTLQISMQDEIGFVRLMHRRYPPLQVLLRGDRPSLLRTSMHAAAFAHLPANGAVRIGGRRYEARSFQEQSWENGPVTIWLLMPA